MKRVAATVLLLVVAGLAYLLAWPIALDPAAWDAPPAPSASGEYSPNNGLTRVERRELESGQGPEDVAVGSDGRLYGGLHDGRIVRTGTDRQRFENWVDTGGRPLGLHFARDGALIVADAVKGLLSVSPGGTIEVLATQADGRPFGFTDDVDLGADGRIYFTDASDRYPFPDYRPDLLENRPYGRLLAYDASTGQAHTLLDGLHFANGVAVDPAGRFVLVNETWRYRVIRYWLSGSRRGEHEVLIENLPGFPDGISTGENGVFWIALFAPRNALLDFTAPRPWLRRALIRLPAWLQPEPRRFGYVLGINERGQVVANLQDPDGVYAPITSVEEWRGRLYLGSLSEPAVGVFKL